MINVHAFQTTDSRVPARPASPVTSDEVVALTPTARPGEAPELYGLQILRGLAAISVAAFHILYKSGSVPGRFVPDWLTLSLSAGVDVFFVISGFIMFYATFARGGPVIAPGEFMLRRAIRIFPLYWFCCLTLLTLIAVHIMRPHAFAFDEIVKSMLLVPGHNSLLVVSWTLSYEMLFYFIFAATLFARSPRVTLVVTSVVIVTAFVVGSLLPAGPVHTFLRGSVLLEFCFGMGLAYVAGRSPTIDPPAIVVAVALLTMLCAPLIVPHHVPVFLDEPFRGLVWGLPAVVVVAAFGALSAGTGRASRWLVRLGDASYAIYLTHLFVVYAYSKAINMPAIGRINQVFVAPLAILVCLIVGLLAHGVVEKPLLRATRRLAVALGLTRSRALPVGSRG